MTLNTPWNDEIRGTQVLPLINLDRSTLRVPAGPGTGKTFGLRRRVLRILHPDVLGASPKRVLVCTFNRVIANDLRREIKEELDSHGLQMPVIRTVHGLAAELASETPRFLLPHEIDAALYDIRLSYPDIDNQYDRRHETAMSALREHEAGFVDHPALGTAFSSWLTEHHVSSIGELPRAVEARIRGGDFEDVKFDHIIIDEFQDLTKIEARLLLSLRSEGGQVVALGDRKQSIYAFRGNNEGGLETLSDLVEGEITDVEMDQCQRCPLEIVRLANDVMATYNEPLIDIRGTGGQIHQVHHPSPNAEHQRMAREIVRVQQACPKQKHLVLVTRRKWGYELRSAIKRIDQSINAQTVYSEDVLETWPVREAFVFLSIVGVPSDAASLRDWLSYKSPNAEGKKWKATNRNASAYSHLKAKHGILDLAKAIELAKLKESDLSGGGRANVLHRLQRLAKLHKELPDAGTTIEMLNHILNPEIWVDPSFGEQELAREDFARLLVECRNILEQPDSDQSLQAVVKQLRYRISTREPLGAGDDPSIKIVTLWGAKGLTADFVYVIGLCDEALPGPFRDGTIGQTDNEHDLEQQRLLYVSLTRAKRALVLSRPQWIARSDVASLSLTPDNRPGSYQQKLKQVRFFKNVSDGNLPDAVAGGKWSGIDLEL